MLTNYSSQGAMNVATIPNGQWPVRCFRPLKLKVMIETMLQNTRYKHRISDWPVVVLSYINCIVDMFR